MTNNQTKNLYRANPSDGIAWITGGSSGIGRGLALELVKRGWKVAVTARNIAPFDENVPIHAYPCDVSDTQAMASTAAKIASDHGPIVLAIFNAGNYIPVSGNDLNINAFQQTFNVNFQGVVNGLVPVVEAMKQNKKGHIAITGSVTSYAGLPTAAAYGASKAALNSMAQSLKFDLDRMNIRIQMINPGFVDSELTKKNNFAMPALMQTDAAAIRLADGLERGGFEIHFPRRLTLPLRFVSMLPYSLYFWLVAKITGANKPLQ